MNDSNETPKRVIDQARLSDLEQVAGELIWVSPWTSIALAICSGFVSGATTAVFLWWLI